MADKGKRDKGKREQQKTAKLTPKEKRKQKKECNICGKEISITEKYNHKKTNQCQKAKKIYDFFNSQ